MRYISLIIISTILGCSNLDNIEDSKTKSEFEQIEDDLSLNEDKQYKYFSECAEMNLETEVFETCEAVGARNFQDIIDYKSQLRREKFPDEEHCIDLGLSQDQLISCRHIGIVKFKEKQRLVELRRLQLQ